MRTQKMFGVIAVVAAACGKPAPQAKTASADSVEMANMPGMKMPMPGDTSAATAGANQVALTASQIQHGAVRWGPASMSSAASTATVPGELTSNEDRTSRLGAPARGRVIEVRVQPGDRVDQGQVLVTMQSTDAAMAQSDASKATAEVSSRQAQAAYATSARSRAERLLALKAIPRQEYERAVADDEQARASLTQSESELRRARSASEQLGAAASASGEIALRALKAGVVASRSASPGTVVEAGAPLVTITDPTTLWLRVNAPEQFVYLFSVGDELRFAVPAYPGELFSARINALSPGLDPETRTLAVRGVVGSANKLKAEMLATVTVSGGPRVAAVLLPDDAVQLFAGQPTVFVVRPDGAGGARFERRSVEVGARTNGRIAVTRGLAAGELIVTSGAFAVKAAFQKGAMPKMEM